MDDKEPIILLNPFHNLFFSHLLIGLMVIVLSKSLCGVTKIYTLPVLQKIYYLVRPYGASQEGGAGVIPAHWNTVQPQWERRCGKGVRDRDPTFSLLF